MELFVKELDNKENINPITGKISGLTRKKSKRCPLVDITSNVLGGIKKGMRDSPREWR